MRLKKNLPPTGNVPDFIVTHIKNIARWIGFL